MQIVSKILSSSFFLHRPPVLIDIGASGEINAKWKPIAAHSICIAFDADDREFKVSESQAAGYRKLITINRIVTANETPVADFYLTASPFCSSLLSPENDKLKPWSFHSLFEVENKLQLPATTISQALKQAGIDYIDWFKTDTQGTDLRLFSSLRDELRNQLLAAEFEPGIIDAYNGEDKLFILMKEVQQAGFWLSTMEVKGTQRLNEKYLVQWGKFAGNRMIRKSPCWAEVTYLHNPVFKDQRSLLLLYVFALLERQYGFALEICDIADQLFRDEIFTDCRVAVFKQLKKEKMKVPLVMLKKQFNKLFAHINA